MSTAFHRSGFLLLAFLGIASHGENIVFPADAGIFDVTKSPYLADSSGRVDATVAINRALNDHWNQGAIIYLPNGTYLISDTLKWPGTVPNGGNDYKNVIMQGQSRDGTIIKLPNNCPGYTSPNGRKPMLWTGPRPPERFRNSVRNLTINTGSGNLGAVGIQYNASNQGCLRDVAIVSGDGNGAIGLDMGFTPEIGPLLVKNVSVTGFTVGILTFDQMNSMTMEHIVLQGQKRYGLYNRGQVVSIRDLKSTNAVTAIYNAGDTSFLTLIDSKFTGTGSASAVPAIVNEGTLIARSCTSSVYDSTIRNVRGTKQSAPGPVVTEFISHPVLSLFPSPQRTLNLPVKETPEVPWDALGQWENVRAHKDKIIVTSDTEWTMAVQAAIDAGKTTVYFPRGAYNVAPTIAVRGAVRRIVGCEADVVPYLASAGQSLFQVVDAAGSAPVVVFERMSGGYVGGIFSIENASSRTVVMKDMCDWNGKATGTGDFFIEDVCSNPWCHWEFGGQSVWARQFNPENEDTHILNNGAKLWILGLKTERGGTLIDTRGGGFTELLGGLCHTTTACRGLPILTNTESSVSASIAEVNNDTILMVDDSGKITWCNNGYCHGVPCTTLVRETRNGVTDSLVRGQVPSHIQTASALPLYVGYKGAGVDRRASIEGVAGVPAVRRGSLVLLDKQQLSGWRPPPGTTRVRVYDMRGKTVGCCASAAPAGSRLPPGFGGAGGVVIVECVRE